MLTISFTIRGKIPIFPATEYSISDMEKAMRLMQSGKHMGKLVLIPGVEDKVKVSSLFLWTDLFL